MRRVIVDSSRAERLSASVLPVRFAYVRASDRNRGLVHVGDMSICTGDPGLEPGRTLGLRGSPSIDLWQVFVMADSGGDCIEVVYVV